jgi:cyclase
MLKRRIIPKFLVRESSLDPKDFEACISQGYSNLKMIGSLKSQLRIFESYKSDELLVINTNKTSDRLDTNFLQAIKESIEELSTPIIVGGRITSTKDATALIEVGVDKVICGISTFNHKLHSEIASLFGSQALSISIDYSIESGVILVGASLKTKFTQNSFLELVKRIENSGAGEIVLNRIDFDGAQSGLDLETLEMVMGLTRIPFILASGAGKIEDFVSAFESGADGVVVGTFFAKMDQNPLQLRSRLFNLGINIRK